MPLIKADFGFYPAKLSVKVHDVSIETRSDFDHLTSDHKSWEGVDGDWIYPPQGSRIFGLPHTHSITHANADDLDHVKHLVWALSFFVGMRLTTTEMGFVDATPITMHKLVDFTCLDRNLPRVISLAEKFWMDNRHDPLQSKRFAAAVHALYFAQTPRHFQFEEFIYLYAALDACYALGASMKKIAKPIPHTRRIAWLCNILGLVTPGWALDASGKGVEIAALRNAKLHEALFVGEPLGFAVYGVGRSDDMNLPLDMRCLICRILVALIGGKSATYLTSPVNTRQRYFLDLQ